MNRRDFLATLTGAAAYGLGARFASAQNPSTGGSDRPNIVHIMADDLGFGDLACYGSPLAKTPNLDRLAEQGALFTQYYQSSPVCSPSRAGTLTGRHPASLGIHCYLAGVGDPTNSETFGSRDYLDPEVTTVAHLLQNNGYATGHFGKWHLGGEIPMRDPAKNAPIPERYGFDEAVSFRSSGRQFEYTAEEEEHRFRHLDRKIADGTIDFIRRHKDEPFYVQCWFNIPHSELDPSDEEMEPYRERSPQTVDYKGDIAVYYGSVTAMDAHIGRILAALDELGLADNTLVVFTSDNGPENQAYHSSHAFIDRSMGPFRGRKRSLYEGGIRVPFIARWPGRIEAGRVDDDSVICGTDWLPTACAVAGVSTSDVPGLVGEDTSDMLLGEARPRRTELLWDWRFPIVWTMRPVDVSPTLALRDGDWKLHMNPDGTRPELYNIPKDPLELDNRVPEETERVEAMKARLLEWYETLPEGPRWNSNNLYPWPKEKE